MNSATEELEAAALSLPRGERARLAERLLASLDEDPEIEEAWANEIEQRLTAYREGSVNSVSAESVIREARRSIDQGK